MIILRFSDLSFKTAPGFETILATAYNELFDSLCSGGEFVGFYSYQTGKLLEFTELPHQWSIAMTVDELHPSYVSLVNRLVNKNGGAILQAFFTKEAVYIEERTFPLFKLTHRVS